MEIVVLQDGTVVTSHQLQRGVFASPLTDDVGPHQCGDGRRGTAGSRAMLQDQRLAPKAHLRGADGRGGAGRKTPVRGRLSERHRARGGTGGRLHERLVGCRAVGTREHGARALGGKRSVTRGGLFT
eukprot:7387693-Prymnesium_polylepis.2